MDAEEKTMQTLIEQRHGLTEVLAQCKGSLLGSLDFGRETLALLMLASFDATHPEVLLKLRAGRGPGPRITSVAEDD